MYLLLSATPCWYDKGRADLETGVSQVLDRQDFITWELVKNPDDGAPPRNTGLETLGVGPADS